MHLYSEASERNKAPIFEAISEVLSQSKEALEIGSGTGQHALYFAEKMPHLRWQLSDCGDYLSALWQHLDIDSIENIVAPVSLDVRVLPWQQDQVDLIYTANSLHIMSWDAVCSLFKGVGQVLAEGGHLIVYGPFTYGGEFTAPSNADFDRWLKSRDAQSGIRDCDAVDQLAAAIGLELITDQSMPANNQCLIWRRDLVI